MRKLSPTLAEHLLRQNATIASRLERLHTAWFGASYWQDLATVGTAPIATLLKTVQQKRNAFAHAQPQAIDDELIGNIVGALQEEHEAWIAIYSMRVARPVSAGASIS